VCIGDLVLNHAAHSGTEWVVTHPEVTYNTKNCPWLNAAYELDKAIISFSHDYAESKVSMCLKAPKVESE
jgi:glycogen debranching enzyme